jgi:hypothetical protein
MSSPLAACSGSTKDKKPSTPGAKPQPVVASKPADRAELPVPPPEPARFCPTAVFATDSGGGVEIYDVGQDCVARVVSTILLDGDVYDIAWPRRDGPLAVAVEDRDGSGTQYVLVVDQPLADEASRGQPRRVVPPGKGETEPEGYQFGLISDGSDIFVERCTSWDDGGSGVEESEEWSCTQHVYFRLNDKAGKKAKPVKPAPRAAFVAAFAGGRVPGTDIELRVERDKVTCIVGAIKEHELDPWGEEPRGVITVVAVSATDYLLGVDRNGGRSSPGKSVWYKRMHECEPEYLYSEVSPGPLPYWAENPQYDEDTWSGWRIHDATGTADEPRYVVNAQGQAEFDAHLLVWTTH